MTDDETRQLVRDELASLGGQMLATHGPGTQHANPTLAAVGGFLLAHYGPDEARDRVIERLASEGAPVGESPTTTPGR